MSAGGAHPALGYRELGAPGAPPRPPLLALASSDFDLESQLAGLEHRFRVLLLAAPRRANPRRFGLPSLTGDWYLGDDEAPDPLGFGLCLEQLERFVVDDAAGLGPGARPLLLGAGQGAALALALACCWPERLAGVVAIAAALPPLPEGMLAERPLAGLPISLAPASSAVEDRARAARAAAALRARGARVRELEPGSIEQALADLACGARC